MTKKYEINDLKEKEYNLIMRIRTKYQYNRLTLLTHNGQPNRIEENKGSDNLDTKIVDE